MSLNLHSLNIREVPVFPAWTNVLTVNVADELSSSRVNIPSTLMYMQSIALLTYPQTATSSAASMESPPRQGIKHTSSADLTTLAMDNVDSSDGLPTSWWNVDCDAMEEVMENDDLLSLLKPYVSRELVQICLTI